MLCRFCRQYFALVVEAFEAGLPPLLCYLRLYKTGRWLELNPLSNQFLAAIYDYPPDFDFPGYIRTRRNVRLCRVEIAAAPPKCAPLSFFTCVEFVKRVIGLHDCFIHTPWQLYQKISKL